MKLSTDHAPRGERLVGPITEYVLGHRPCRVVVDRSPLAETPEAHEAGGTADRRAPPVMGTLAQG